MLTKVTIEMIEHDNIVCDDTPGANKPLPKWYDMPCDGVYIIDSLQLDLMNENWRKLLPVEYYYGEIISCK